MPRFWPAGKTAVSYVPYGCGEYVIDHESFGTPSGVLNVMKGLELFLDAQGQTENPDAEYLEGGDGKRRMQELKEAACPIFPCCTTTASSGGRDCFPAGSVIWAAPWKATETSMPPTALPPKAGI